MTNWWTPDHLLMLFKVAASSRASVRLESATAPTSTWYRIARSRL